MHVYTHTCTYIYHKWFLEGIGHEGLNNMLAAYPDKSAYAQTYFAFSKDKDSEPMLVLLTIILLLFNSQRY